MKQLSTKEDLDEEKLQDSDACVALTGMDEENVIISLYAKSKGVPKIVTKVDKTSMGNMVSKLGLDTIVSPRDIIANDIVRFVRAHQSRDTDNINTLYKLYDIAEAIELNVDEKFTSTNIPLKDLPIKDNVLIGGIVRNGEFILPEGKTVIKNDDKVIILTIDKQITKLNQIIK